MTGFSSLRLGIASKLAMHSLAVSVPPHLCREESRQKCSGQPGCGPPARWRRQCQSSRLCSAAFAAAQNSRCLPQTARCARISVVDKCFYSKDSARSRRPLYPASTSSRAHSLEPSRLRPGRPSANRTMPVFVGVWEPKVSQTLRRQSPPSPSRQTASPATLHFVPRPWSFRDSKAGSRIRSGAKLNDITRITDQPLRL